MDPLASSASTILWKCVWMTLLQTPVADSLLRAQRDTPSPCTDLSGPGPGKLLSLRSRLSDPTPHILPDSLMLQQHLFSPGASVRWNPHPLAPWVPTSSVEHTLEHTFGQPLALLLSLLELLLNSPPVQQGKLLPAGVRCGPHQDQDPDQGQGLWGPEGPRHPSLIWTSIGHMGAGCWEQELLRSQLNMGTYWDQFSQQMQLI